MKLLVGLGNPGDKYAATRHNVGFRFLDELTRNEALEWTPAPRFRAHIAEWACAADKVLLVKPQTFMNNSGEAVGALARYYRLATADIFVVYDDLDLPAGKFRLKTGGGHGGHNGLRSLNQHLPDAAYHRVKIGIGRPPQGMDVTPWVLGRASAEERASEQRIFAALLRELPTVLKGDLAAASNRMHLYLREI
ncbi:MAG: aminoacyl-tRNA hydrolase [Zetaproteobacteria bacterium]|nr:MAG: aminoacyl-tRNA hydrolase [Zetaproteobacteria bacterium]